MMGDLWSRFLLPPVHSCFHHFYLHFLTELSYHFFPLFTFVCDFSSLLKNLLVLRLLWNRSSSSF